MSSVQDKLRKLKFHEQKLLKKVDFLSWESDGNQQYRQFMLNVIAQFKLRDQDEFHKYQRIVNEINGALKEIKALKGDEYKQFCEEQTTIIRNKLYQMGILAEKDGEIKRINVADICRRRLSYLMYKNHFCEGVTIACTYISQGHVRIGPEVVTDPAYLVTRNLEDFITWVDVSKIKKTILRFNEELDDYNELNC